PLPPRSPPFPYTTLFRSRRVGATNYVRAAHRANYLQCFWCKRDQRRLLVLEESLKSTVIDLAFKCPNSREDLLLLCLRYKINTRSEEHTSELQSRENLVC